MDEPGIRVTFRLYEELNRFLPPERRKVSFAVAAVAGATVQEVLEALRVPPAEVDLVLVRGTPAALDRILRDGDHVSVYPVFEALDIASVTPLPGRPLRTPRFVLDSHLGKLARLLRLLGFDARWRRAYGPGQLVRISSGESRILLSRGPVAASRGVDRGLRLSSGDPRAQLLEVLDRLDLRALAAPFTRCLECNGVLQPVAKEDVEAELPPRARERFDDFLRCSVCRRVYWPGSHWQKLWRTVADVIGKASTGC